jgi:hypothetical protein
VEEERHLLFGENPVFPSITSLNSRQNRVF